MGGWVTERGWWMDKGGERGEGVKGVRGVGG